MPQDLFDDESKIRQSENSEAITGELINTNLPQAELNGSTSYIATPITTETTGWTGFTLHARVNLNSLNSGGSVFGKDITGDRQFYLNPFTGNKFRFLVSDDGTNIDFIDSNFTFTFGEDVFVTATWDMIDLNIYINGVLDKTASAVSSTSALSSEASVLEIGRTSSIYFDGNISDARIYSEALDAATILALVEHSTEPSATNLELHYKFQGNVLDSSLNSYNGTANNITYINPSFALDSRTIHDSIIGTPSTVIEDHNYTISKKAGGTQGVIVYSTDYDTADEATSFDFADSQATWKNANGDVIQYGAYDFDGVNDYITVLDSASLSFGDASTDSPFSISQWAFIDDATRFTFSGKVTNVTNGTAEFLFGTTGADKIALFLYDNSASHSIARTGPALTEYEGKWAHFTATYSGNGATTGIKLYINGLQVDDLNSTSGTYVAMHDTSTAFEIGVRLRGGTPNWSNGKIGETLVMSKEMSATEVFDNYSDGTIPIGTIAAHWKFNGNALDETANNNDGIVSGATSIASSEYELLPVIGQNLGETKTQLFDGVNDYLNNTSPSFVNDTSGSLGIWFKSNSLTAQEVLFSVGQANASQDEIVIQIETNGTLRLAGAINGSFNLRLDTASGTITANTIHHIMFTSNGSTITCYVDNVIKTLSPTTGSNTGQWFATATDADRVTIGAAHRSTLLGFFSGVIYSCEVQNAALLASEVQDHYESGFPINTANLVSYWPLAGDFLDKVGINNLINNGSTEINDILRPQPETPTQQTIDISSLGFTDVYLKSRFRSATGKSSFGLDSYELVVAIPSGRRIIIVRRRSC